MASTKKDNPSNANGRPRTSPKRPIRPGHNRPISKLSTVPETAPIANSTADTFPHRRAKSRATVSARTMPRRCTTKIIVGKATPKHASTMCQPSDTAICWRAGNNPGGSPLEASTSSASFNPIGARTTLPPAGQTRRSDVGQSARLGTVRTSADLILVCHAERERGGNDCHARSTRFRGDGGLDHRSGLSSAAAGEGTRARVDRAQRFAQPVGGRSVDGTTNYFYGRRIGRGPSHSLLRDRSDSRFETWAK